MTTQAITRDDLEKLACHLEDMIIVADDSGEARLSRALNRACDAIEQAINAIGSSATAEG